MRRMEDEEHRTVDFVRLVSDDSCVSTISDDSCVYHRTEIFDQLPSFRACRPQAGQGERVGGEAQGGGPGPGVERQHAPLAGGARDKASIRPLRSLAVCMQGKREARNRRALQRHSIGSWESWRRGQSLAWKRLKQQVRNAFLGLLPWRRTLHTIEGRFGVGVKAYFLFLRYLVFVNALHALIVWGSVLEPARRYGRANGSEPLVFGGNDSVLDFFLGSGYLERSPVFYGFYTRGSLDSPCLNTPLLFLSGILTLLILSLVMVVRRTAVGYKHSWLLGNHYTFNASLKLFCGWDYNIQEPSAAALEHSFIRNDLRVYLDEQQFYQREARRTWRQWACLYFLRVLINFLVLLMLGGAFCLIYYAAKAAEAESQTTGLFWLVRLVLQFLPPLVISVINLTFPFLFENLAALEDYSVTTQLNTTLLRSISLKLACLGIYLFFLFSMDTQECWENHFGKEMYKLSVFDFLSCFCTAFLFEYPRKLALERFPSSGVSRLLGRPRFLIPFSVLDLVYGQTVSWVGVFYCPLLPLLATPKLVAVFYIKKFTVLRCCVPDQRMFRVSRSSVLFHLMLLLGLVMAFSTLGINLHQFPPSPSCGPLAGVRSVFNVTAVCVDSLPGSAQTAARYLTSEAFALTLILTEIVILTSYVSRVRANHRAIDRLKDMLMMCGSDKRFLVKQHHTLLRRRQRTPRTPRTPDPGAGSGTGSPEDPWKDPGPTGS